MLVFSEREMYQFRCALSTAAGPPPAANYTCNEASEPCSAGIQLLSPSPLPGAQGWVCPWLSVPRPGVEALQNMHRDYTDVQTPPKKTFLPVRSRDSWKSVPFATLSLSSSLKKLHCVLADIHNKSTKIDYLSLFPVVTQFL